MPAAPAWLPRSWPSRPTPSSRVPKDGSIERWLGSTCHTDTFFFTVAMVRGTQRGAPGQAALRPRYVQHAGGGYASPVRTVRRLRHARVSTAGRLLVGERQRHAADRERARIAGDAGGCGRDSRAHERRRGREGHKQGSGAVHEREGDERAGHRRLVFRPRLKLAREMGTPGLFDRAGAQCTLRIMPANNPPCFFGGSSTLRYPPSRP